MNARRFCALSLLLLSVLCTPAVAALSDFDPYTKYDDDPSIYVPYRLYVPEQYDPAEEYPVMMYLHSSGNTGTDNVGPCTHPNCTAMLNWAKQDETAAFVLVPQYGVGSYTGDYMRLTLEILDDLAATYSIDSSRVYASGWSLGGLGSVYLMGHHADKVAAGAPMAGGVSYVDAEDLVGKALWFFQGALDTNSITQPAAVLPTIQQSWALGSTVLYTEYPDGTHLTTPEKGYAEPALFPWMWSQQVGQEHDTSMFVFVDSGATSPSVVTGAQRDMYLWEPELYGGLVVDGGDLTARNAYLGMQVTGSESMTLSGAGARFRVTEAFGVGYMGDAEIVQTGGLCDVETFYLGYSTGVSATYQLAGGSLRAGLMVIGRNGQASMEVTDPDADITVTSILRIGAQGELHAAPGTTFALSDASFENFSTHAADVAELLNVSLVFQDGTSARQFQVGGRDLGADIRGLADNFAIDTLQVADASVLLHDAVDNQPSWVGAEALYVKELVLEAGAALNLGGLHVYYIDSQIDPAAQIVLDGGTLTQLPSATGPGDFDGDGQITAADVDLLVDWAETTSYLDRFDLDADGDIDEDDYETLIYDVLDTRPGDASLDGAVDAADLSLLAANWNLCGKGWGQGDANGDGCVNAGDLSLVAANWQYVRPTGGTVPEPATAALLACGLTAILRKRRA